MRRRAWLVLGCVVGTGASAADTKPGHAGGTAVKPVVCRAVADARGKSGQELAQTLEHDAIELASTGYVLAALLSGDPPVACYRHEGPSPKPGAR
ncbi:MAG TPA: hypothetical protein VMT11_00475 [Myxococcaceae bacterium]|nr:hypothetical protein [Myxococcaceae bacterium]